MESISVNRRSVLLLFISITLSDKLFSSENVEGIAAQFSTSSNNFFLVAFNTVITLFIILFHIKEFKKIKVFLVPFFLLALYAISSAVWSPSLLKSGGLATLTFFNLFWGIFVGKYLANNPNSDQRLTSFISLWTSFVIIDFIIEVVFKGFPANLDEFSLIAFFLCFLSLKNGSFSFALILFFIGVSGESFSAILSMLVFLLSSAFLNRSFFGALATLLLLGGAEVYRRFFLLADQIVFGKSLGLLLTGSGRFDAWEAVYNSIISATWINIIFGHGYASERQVLVAEHLTWSVDVHNNILHLWYGLGFIGFLFFVSGIFLSLRTKIDSNFYHVRFPLLLALLLFGFSSSYFFGRPSMIAVMWVSFIIAASKDGLPAQIEHISHTDKKRAMPKP